MIIKFKNLSEIRKSLSNKKIVLGEGTFDLIHFGHIEYLKGLKKFGDIVVVEISSNKMVQQRKGLLRPFVDEKERAAIIDAIRYVDYTFIAPEPHPQKENPILQIICSLRPNVFVSIDKEWLRYRKKIEHCGTALKVINVVKPYSTSNIVRKIIRQERE